MLTGYWPVIGASVAICFREGPTILLVPEDEKELAEDGFADSIMTFAAETLDDMQSITDAVKASFDRQLFKRFISVAGPSASSRQAVRRRLRTLRFIFSGTILRTSFAKRFLTRALTPAERWIRDLKSVKTRFEIEKIRTACGIARNSFEMGASRLRAGMDEPEAAELFRAALQSAKPSARDFVRSDGFVFCMSGPNAAKASAAYARTRHRTSGAGRHGHDPLQFLCGRFLDGYYAHLHFPATR